MLKVLLKVLKVSFSFLVFFFEFSPLSTVQEFFYFLNGKQTQSEKSHPMPCALDTSIAVAVAGQSNRAGHPLTASASGRSLAAVAR